jgi:hypothetical protein
MPKFKRGDICNVTVNRAMCLVLDVVVADDRSWYEVQWVTNDKGEYNYNAKTQTYDVNDVDRFNLWCKLEDMESNNG